MHVLGWWKEAGVPGEDPLIHGENMQTPHRKALAWIRGGGAKHHTTVQPTLATVFTKRVKQY